MRARLVTQTFAKSAQRPWISRRSYASITRVSLAYDLHEPPQGCNPKHAPIVFMHGLFGSKKNNRSIILARDLGRAIYAVDLRNHGDSPHDPVHNYMAMAEDVAGFIDEHKLTDTSLIGHSMGAKTAMTLALRSPELIHDMISVDNAPIDAALQSNFGKYLQGMRKVEEADITNQARAHEILQQFEESLPIRQFLLANLHIPPGSDEKGSVVRKFKIPLKILGSSLNNLGDFPFKDPEEVRFEKPALFVRGTQSKYVPDEALPVIGKFFPRFELADIDCGHWVISEKAQDFRRVVVEFLKPKE